MASGHAPIQILGAGLTGMSAGRSLGSSCEIHERLPHSGGHAITLEEAGFRFDRTGHLLHLRDPDIRGWVENMIGQDCVQVSRNSRVFSHGVYTRYPYQANTYGLPPKVAHECLMGFLKATRALDASGGKPASPPENFEEFCLMHFGRGFSEHFMIPYNRKLWGVHPREITAEWCSRFVPMPKLEDVVAGAVGLNDRELGYNTNFLYPREGIGELPSAMARDLACPLHLESSPSAIDAKTRRLIFASSGTEKAVPYQALVSTIPLDALLGLIKDLPEQVAAAARTLRCNHLWYLDVALDVPCGVPGLHWAYVPEERYPFYRVGCYSNFSPAMAPPGKASLYVELASREEPEMAQLLPEVSTGLTDMGLISRPEDLLFARKRRIDHAYVVFDHAYYDALAVIGPYLENHDIISTGRYGAWNYSSMEDALIFGRDAARQARSLLGARPSG